MESINQRIAAILRTLGVTQTVFAEKIGLSQNYISSICKGRKMPSDRTILDICRAFGVSEEWLRSGTGDMFGKRSEDEELEQILAEIVASDDQLIKRIIRSCWRLNEPEKEVVCKLIDGFLPAAETPSDSSEKTELEEAEAAYIKSLRSCAENGTICFEYLVRHNSRINKKAPKRR